MMLSALHDPEGTQERKGKRLKRKVYHSKVCHYIKTIVNTEGTIIIIFIIRVQITYGMLMAMTN